MKTYIIAEAGVNHNGSLTLAKKLANVAKSAGADAVKFQTFKTENVVTRHARQANYQIQNLGEVSSQFSMLKKLELSFEQFVTLKNYCDELGIEFLSTPFDHESVHFLIDELELSQIKIPSGELTNAPFLHYIATRGKQMILSTGMATIEEIHEALSFIAYGLLKPDEEIALDQVKSLYNTTDAKQVLGKHVQLLHCTTQYPAPIESINLNAIKKMKEVFQLPIGLSDHSEGIHIPIAAVAMGARVIEKHFTLDKTMEGPDHIASLNPTELKKMVDQVRDIENSFGNGEKIPTSAELQNVIASRRSLVAKMPIKAGEFFTPHNLTTKRPGYGKSPSLYWNYIGQPASKNYEADQLIDE